MGPPNRGLHLGIAPTKRLNVLAERRYPVPMASFKLSTKAAKRNSAVPTCKSPS